MTNEEAIRYLKSLKICHDNCELCSIKDYEDGKHCLHEKALSMAIQALEQEPCRDMEEIKEVMSCDADAETKCKMISNILTAEPHYFEKQEPKTKQFAEWVAEEIFDDNWEYNKESFAEIACRKLHKLGIVKQEGDKWVYEHEEKTQYH